jgi:cytochrome c-type biogenesis protein CcmH
MIWFLFGVMLLAAALCVAWPLYRHERRLLSPGLAAGVGTVLLLSAVLYSRIGTPVPPAAPDVGEMIASLEGRLANEPDNLEGWKMLGRSHMQLENFAEAVRAYARAVELESGTNAQTLADLGEALLNSDSDSITGRAGELFENAVAVGPDNPKALFFGGIAAVARGDADLAADRWEALLAQSPPPEVQAILRERIAAWRGQGSGNAVPASAATGEAVVRVAVSMSEDARQAIGPDATVYIIARDPAQPSPPIAAVRRKAGELPLSVALGDADSMIPGRLLSSFDRLEIVARASLSGQPLEQAGDWYGRQTIAAGDAAEIRIERKVP